MFDQLLKNLAKGLDLASIPYMIIGGQAVLLYGTPRLTRDIDLTLGVDIDKLEMIVSLVADLHLRLLGNNPRQFARDKRVLIAEHLESKIRIDFIFSFTPYERQAMERVTSVSIADYPVKYASCEDLIIHKIFAARPIDDEDIAMVLLKQKSKLDLSYIRKWLAEFDKTFESSKYLSRFEQHLKKLD